MARIAGIQIEKNAKGIATHVRIDLKKHGDTIKPILQNLGAISNDEANSFQKEWQAGGVSYKVARTHLYKTIDKLPWKKK
jgi:hypothetical protein